MRDHICKGLEKIGIDSSKTAVIPTDEMGEMDRILNSML